MTKTSNPFQRQKTPMNPRPIALLGDLGKAAEKMVLARAKWKVGELHTNLYAYIVAECFLGSMTSGFCNADCVSHLYA